MESGATQHVERGGVTDTARAAGELGALCSVVIGTKGQAGQLDRGLLRIGEGGKES
jgi:hypothetical protein